jgi:hypothetical protein
MDTKIFATRSDLMPRIEWIEWQKDLHYAISDMYKSKDIEILSSLLGIKEIGYNNTGQYTSGTQFLVVEKKYKIRTEKIRQKKGGYLYDVGPLKNPHSIIFQPGGIYNDSKLIRGSIGTVTESKKSIELYKFFSKEIVQGFTKIKDWYVGPEALKLMESGVRLITMHVHESPKHDLVR